MILAAYLFARLLEIVPNPIPRMAIVALDVFSATAFALVHGTRFYRLRGILVFAAICAVVGNITENLGVLTGFPFGHYYFLDLMGPKLFQVPVLLGLAYIGMAFVSWTLARLILGDFVAPVVGVRIVALPLVASFVMTAWDLAQDPVWSTVLHGWVWRDGGPWFGVPISNYLGWYANVFLIYLLFALYLGRHSELPLTVPRSALRPAVFFYLACAVCNILQVLPRPDTVFVADPAGHMWRSVDIAAASALVSVFVMGGFVAIAWIRSTGAQGDYL